MKSLPTGYPRYCGLWMRALFLTLGFWLGNVQSFQVRLTSRQCKRGTPKLSVVWNKPRLHSSTFMSSKDNDDEREDPTLIALRKKREQILSKKTKKEEDKTVSEKGGLQSSSTSSQDANKARIASILNAKEATTSKKSNVVPPASSSAPPSNPKQQPKSGTTPASQRSPPKSSQRQPQPAKTPDYLQHTTFSLPPDENELHIPHRIGFGTQSWGDATRGFTMERKMTKKMAKEGKLFNAGDLISAYQILLNGGITFIDTSEAYGRTRAQGEEEALSSAEQIVAMCIEQSSSSPLGGTPILASKFEPRQNILRRFMGSSSVVRAVRNSCERLETNCLDLYQLDVTQPTFFMGGKTALAAGLAKAVDMGLCNHVGVCNMNARQMKSMHRKLDRAGVPLVSNQVSKQEYSSKETKERCVLVSLLIGIIYMLTYFSICNCNGLMTYLLFVHNSDGTV